VHRYPVKLPEQEKQSKFADLHSFRNPKLTKQGLLESSLATLCQMPVATIFARPLGREVCTKSVSGQEHYSLKGSLCPLGPASAPFGLKHVLS
jgi:hypothetical protein